MNPYAPALRFIPALGRRLIDSIEQLGALFLFLLYGFWRVLFVRAFFRKLAVAIYEIGVRCTVVVLLVGLFTGMVLGLSLFNVLADFGSESKLGSIIANGIIRGLGPVLTALMIVGQAGSALSAELGIQRNSEQVDALDSMNIEPVGFLIGPRLVAAIIVFPILTAFFNLIGLSGGYLTGVLLLGLDHGVYWSDIMLNTTLVDIRDSFIYAGTFGILTMLICTFEGYYTHQRSRARGARGVSESTTRAVVLSSVTVFIVFYLITSFLV